LTSFGHLATARHCAAVAKKAMELAEQYQCDPNKAEKAGYLHDISAVIPDDQKIDFAHSQLVEVLPEESQFPMIIHQKLSVVLAEKVFNIKDQEILSAIGCHTTLKPNASMIDKVVFLADKIAWDQEGKPPYGQKVIEKLEVSIESAIFVYMNFLWEKRNQLRVLHPWLIEARDELLQTT
jgi:predicted HD superfamily hydrolase involved in NAD metabolism